jgi:hypothetical protein
MKLLNILLGKHNSAIYTDAKNRLSNIRKRLEFNHYQFKCVNVDDYKIIYFTEIHQ